MKTSRVVLFVIAVNVIPIGGWWIHSSADDRVQPIPDAITADGPDVAAPLVMQAKLAASQRILEGLLNHDFTAIQSSAQELVRLAEATHGARDEVRDDRVYTHFRTEFMRLSVQLESMAEVRNLEGAAYVHQNLTATCIACHTHLRDESAE